MVHRQIQHQYSADLGLSCGQGSCIAALCSSPTDESCICPDRRSGAPPWRRDLTECLYSNCTQLDYYGRYRQRRKDVEQSLTGRIRNGWHHVSSLRPTKHSRGLNGYPNSYHLRLSANIFCCENGLHTVEARAKLGLGRHHFLDIIGWLRSYALGKCDTDMNCRCFWFSRCHYSVSVCISGCCYPFHLSDGSPLPFRPPPRRESGYCLHREPRI